MSWRLVTKHLIERGALTNMQLSNLLGTDGDTLDKWLRYAKELGAVESPRVGLHRATLMAQAMYEGRVELIRMRPGGYAWRATWMQPLPRYAEVAA